MSSANPAQSPVSAPRIVRVVLDVPLDQWFDYLNPGLPVLPGNRVVVPFAGRQLVAIVMAVAEDTEVPANKLKAILQVFDDVPLDTACLLYTSPSHETIGRISVGGVGV